MAVFKCKMCGGDLSIIEGQTVCECEYCGSRQTVPTLDSEKKVTLFSRANRLRAMCEFDKAYSLYESIVADYPEEAEAYWGLVLCKYGIEYVDDPKTGKKIPTCHRSSFDNVMEDGNFELVMEYADAIARPVYRAEAKEIERLRSDILEVSSKEEPYDIFICYKETDDKGDRTVDSLIAQDAYDALTEKGYRVFFSRISLEDKLGQEYEPYIFAALHSARIMLVFGTSYDNFNAVWVKNEWSRYLSLIAKGEKKTLIPCYKDVDAYDMPQEFRKLQAQDMGKVGARQDLLRGIEKITPLIIEQSTSTDTTQSSLQNIVDPLLKRAFMFLEDGNWQNANEYCEKILDLEPENAEAYLGKLMAELHVRTRDALKTQPELFNKSINFKKAYQFGDERQKTKLTEDLAFISETIKRKPTAVALALFSTFIEDSLATANTRIHNLEQLLSVFDEKQEEKAVFQREIDESTLREKQLSEQRSMLGLFSSKEKKRIDEEMAELIQRKKRLADQIAQSQSKFGNYTAKGDIERDLNLSRKRADELQMLTESARSNNGIEFGFQEALNIYISEPDVTRAVNTALYPTFDQGSIAFGKYIHKKGRQPVPIEWRVLARENGRILVISKGALDCQKYNTTSSKTTWENCSLRKWLNETFLNEAFSNEERNCIISGTVTTGINPAYGTSSGNNTIDKVFLLSVTEVTKYFNSEEERKCRSTMYAYEQGAGVNGSAICRWWLRSPGRTSDRAAIIHFTGDVHYHGFFIDDNSVGVRPAMWIKISANN